MRTFRRPMFRKGGNVGTGVMTGIVDRSMHANDPFVGRDEFKIPTYSDQLLEQQANETVAFPTRDLGPKPDKERSLAEIQEMMGAYGGMDPITSYLLAAGPKIAGSTSWADAISNLEDPNKMLIKQAADKAAYDRGLRMEGYRAFKEDEDRYGDRQYEYGKDKTAFDLDEAIGKRTRASDKLKQQNLWKREDKLIQEKNETQERLINLEYELQDKNLTKQQKWEKEKQLEDNKQKMLRLQAQLENENNWQDEEIKKEVVTIMQTDDIPKFQAENRANWKWKKTGDLSGQGYNIGSIFTNKHRTDSKALAKFAKTEGRAGKTGYVYYDDVKDVVFQLTGNKDKGFRFVELDEDMSVVPTSGEESIVTGSEVSLTYPDAQIEAQKRNLALIPERPKSEGKNKQWLRQQKEILGKDAVTKQQLEEIIWKEKFAERYKKIKPRHQMKN